MSFQARGGLSPLTSTPSFRSFHSTEGATKGKLLCFPGINGTFAHFRRWPAAFPEWEIWAFSWPEGVPDDYHLFLTSIAEEIRPQLDRPFAIFGYSLGGIPAFGLANLLRQMFSLEPAALFMAATVAPNAPPALQNEVRGLLSLALSDLGPSVFESLYDEQRSLWRSHCEACSTLFPFACPLVAFGGWQDSMIPYHALEFWAGYTSGLFSLQMFEGDHSFPFTQTDLLIEKVKEGLPAMRGHETETKVSHEESP